MNWQIIKRVKLIIAKGTSYYFLLFNILMHHNMIIIYFRLPYFHVSNSALFST